LRLGLRPGPSLRRRLLVVPTPLTLCASVRSGSSCRSRQCRSALPAPQRCDGRPQSAQWAPGRARGYAGGAGASYAAI
jgi:hypothetical protein